ncbi:MAG: META domain-containing protein, partial [Loktanella sp.]|nr:META domain-containing protein [Loktanella sp.]
MRHLSALISVLAVLPLSALAQEVRLVTGLVSYLDRMALPDDAVLLVEASDPAGVLVSESRVPTLGQQVPLAFAVEVPQGQDVVLRAGILLGTDLVWLGDAEPLDTQEPVDLLLQRYQPIGFNATFRCGDRLVQTGFADDALVMDTGDDRTLLQAVATASGARYDALGDPGTFFWNRGSTALVSVGDEEWPECRLALPPDAPDYVARGNEPFWNVTITKGEMVLSRPGLDDLVVSVTDAGLQSDGAIYVAGNGGAMLLREDNMCQDSMSGMVYPETTTLTLGGEVITGCGGDSRDLLVGRDWLVQDIADRPLDDGIAVSLVFDKAGRVAGAGGCNRWFAGYELTGESLTFSHAGATMMACPEPQMAAERLFFTALERVDGFAIDADGALVLLSAELPVIRALPAPA